MLDFLKSVYKQEKTFVIIKLQRLFVIDKYFRHESARSRFGCPSFPMNTPANTL